MSIGKRGYCRGGVEGEVIFGVPFGVVPVVGNAVVLGAVPLFGLSDPLDVVFPGIAPLFMVEPLFMVVPFWLLDRFCRWCREDCMVLALLVAPVLLFMLEPVWLPVLWGLLGDCAKPKVANVPNARIAAERRMFIRNLSS